MVSKGKESVETAAIMGASVRQFKSHQRREEGEAKEDIIEDMSDLINETMEAPDIKEEDLRRSLTG